VQEELGLSSDKELVFLLTLVCVSSCPEQVKLIDFSPGEKFIVTYSTHEPSNLRDTQVYSVLSSICTTIIIFW